MNKKAFQDSYPDDSAIAMAVVDSMSTVCSSRVIGMATRQLRSSILRTITVRFPVTFTAA